MGFDENMAALMMKQCNNNINDAIQCLLLSDPMSNNTNNNKPIIEPTSCDLEVTKCDQLIKLNEMVKEYNNNKPQFENNDIVKTLDCFHHLLAFHSRDNQQFTSVYKLFGGKCDAAKCKNVRRHFRNREITENESERKRDGKECKALCVEDIFSSIHCHIHHQYDIGSKLTENEEKYLAELKVDDTKDDDVYGSTKKNGRTIKLRNILKEKLLKSQQITNRHRNTKNNKFSSNLYQSVEHKTNDHDDDGQKNTISTYSYSFRFNYKDKYRYSQKEYGGRTYSDFYVPTKHETLKDELISNEIYCIHINSWDFAMKKAMLLQQTINARKSWAKTQKYLPAFQHLPHHPTHFGYIDGSPITLEHLMVLYIYCSADEFQRKFSETFRNTKKEQTLKDIIKIHSNFHHFAKYLKEAIQVHGTAYQDGDIKRMYHGINQEMIFDSTMALIYGPLSTTYEWDVAVQFSCNIGLVLELVPGPTLKYFRCEWISPFSAEGELLFIGGFGVINFLNITSAQFGYDYKEYIKSLRIIDTMTDGIYFMNDPANIHKAIRYNTFSVSSLKLVSLSLWDKQLCLALIYHELHRNGYKQINDTHSQIDELPDLNEYIDQLLHQICLNKQEMRISWKTMNVKTLTECDKRSGGGYIGYRWLRKLFCGKDYEGINLNVFHALFPNLLMVRVRDLSSIQSYFLNDIYTFIQTGKSKIYYFELSISKEYGYSNIHQQCDHFQAKFKNIGFRLFTSEDKTFQTQMIVIRKH